MATLYFGKRHGVIVLFGALGVIFVYTYLFGDEGLYAWWLVRAENHALQQELLHRRADCAQRAREIEQWKESDFLREKTAREVLQMVRKGEVVYYLDR